MKTKNFGKEFNKINVGINPEKTQLNNQSYINDLIKLKEKTETIPTFIPKKFIDQIQFYFDGTSEYRVYFYINNTWKYIILT